MKLTSDNITNIIDAFSKMHSKEDFLALLNYAKVIVYSEKAIPFEVKHINYYSNTKANSKRYIQFSIKKKSGAERKIHAPVKGLKAIQKCLNVIFQAIYEPNSCVSGFVSGKCIVDNAKIHAGSSYVYNIDLKDFFPSIEAGRIWSRLQHPPYNLNEKTGRKDLATIITKLCCHAMEVERLDENNQWQKKIINVLPQGAPTSPILTNIICQQLDFYLSAVAKRFGLKYSRYADDITFSSMHNVYNRDCKIVNKEGRNFIQELDRVIAKQNFHIKESKTRLQKQGYRQEVTGLLVNEKPNVQKRYIKQLRMWLYFWETYGYIKANSYFMQQYKADKGHIKKGNPEMVNVISGKLDFLKMVKGAENKTYLNLKERFDLLSGNSSPLSAILDIWENNGIEKAIELYTDKIH